MQGDPDAELLARVAASEPQAVREMVARKLPRLLALGVRLLGRRVEAEEMAQEAFVRVWKQAGSWTGGQARFDTWLHRVALNLCYDRLRARRDEEPLGEAHEQAADASATPHERLDATQRSARVAAALAALPARQREAMVLQYYQELSNTEASALMGISVEALESLLARARRAMRASLSGDAKENP